MSEINNPVIKHSVYTNTSVTKKELAKDKGFGGSLTLTQMVIRFKILDLYYAEFGIQIEPDAFYKMRKLNPSLANFIYSKI